MARASRPLTVTLGEFRSGVHARVKSGAYASASEVMRAALRALEREEAAIDGWLKRRVDEAFEDQGRDVPAREVFARLRAHHARESKKRRRGQG